MEQTPALSTGFLLFERTPAVTEEESLSLSLSAKKNCSNQITLLDGNGSPVASPLKSVEDVLSWTPGRDELCVPVVPLKKNLSFMCNPTAQKVIVCHDMMGGYNMDRFVQGHGGLEDFNFYHWQHIGAFIYFSHNFVTIPPPTWTNVAHRHGVLSMGTVITEWQDGAKRCHHLLSDETRVVQFAQQLVALAQYYHIDGWLVNIENPIHPAHIDRLYMLLSLLTTGMHDVHPDSKVIWYDSVTVVGDLKWQNKLNDFNESFFGFCDGIFLNYNWNEEGLRSTCQLAGERRGDVYVGVDVFGRGCYGGGGYNSCKALEVIKHHGLSTAVFAPGWVFETQDKACFFQNQDRFWSLLSPHCPTTALQYLPLVTSFGKGCGKLMAIDGNVVYEGPWTNLSAQDLQPSFTTNGIVNNTQGAVQLDSMDVDTSTAYNNGASLMLKGRVKSGGSNSPALARLFKVDMKWTEPVLVAYTFKMEQSCVVRHFLQLRSVNGTKTILLDPHGSDVNTAVTGKGLPSSCTPPLPPWSGTNLSVFAPLQEPDHSALHKMFTGSKEHTQPWQTRYFLVKESEIVGSLMEEISIAVCPDEYPNCLFSLSIGEVKIVDCKCIFPGVKPSVITNLGCRDIQYSDHTLSATLKWEFANNPVDPIEHCNIFSVCIIGNPDHQDSWKSDYTYLGRAYANCFRITNLDVLSTDLEESPFSFEFRVQAVTHSRIKASIDESSSLILQISA